MLAATADIPGAVPVSEQAGVRLRPLTVTDCKSLSRWMRLSGDISKPRFASAARMGVYLVRLKGVQTCYMAVCLGKTLVGYCGWNHHAFVDVYIRPTHRGQGIGSKAMRLLFVEAKSRRKMKLCAVTSRPDFFMKLGFRHVHSWRLPEAERQIGGRVALMWGHWGGGREYGTT